MARPPCDCGSYNRDDPGVGRPEIPLDPPEWLQDMRGHDRPDRPVPVDACIAATVKAVWLAGYMTLGSCCGHGGRVTPRPSLVLHGDVRDFAGLRDLLAEVDGREWELLQWQLVEVA